LTQTVTRQPLNEEAWFRYQRSPCRILGAQNITGTGLPARSSVFLCQYNSISIPYSSSSCCYWRANRRNWGTFQKAMLFRNSWSIG